MTTATKKTYKALIILDIRGREESADGLIEEVKKEISDVGIDVLNIEDLGRRDFARQPDPKNPAGNYVQFELAGPPETSVLLREHFKLNPVVFRMLIQAV